MAEVEVEVVAEVLEEDEEDEEEEEESLVTTSQPTNSTERVRG